MKERFYLTTAIPYVNAPPHIGHALLFVYADAMARFERLMGRDVRFLTGTDEHGQKIEQKAKEAGLTPLAFADQVSQTVRDMVRELNISNTDFVRTTEPRHRVAVEAFWKRVMDAGHIYKKRYGGLYCIGCEQFKTEKELVDGKCPDHHIVPEYIEEENYFFRLSSFAPQLLKLYADQPDYVIPDTRFHEMKKIVEGGLEDMSISRSAERLPWGIPVPGDPTQVIYVWFDALVNYLTGAGFGTNEEAFKKWWPADVHVLGQEINRFHSILWVAMLMAAGLEAPRGFAVHGWITVEGQKMSKTLGNVVTPKQLTDRFGVDGSRYLLLREFPFTGDGDYSETRFAERYTSDLANNIGNLLHRTTAMAQKYFGGQAPRPSSTTIGYDFDGYADAVRAWRFDLALEFIRVYVDEQNRRIDVTKPWDLAKAGKTEELADVISGILESLRHVAWLIRPFMPAASDEMLARLGQPAERESLTFADALTWNALKEGTPIATGEPLFPRLDA